MHMADALVSPAVAGTAGAAAATLIAVAATKVKKIRRDDIVPLMGVMGAFVFAAQMINFTIPGTGSSGHVIGGVLLAAVLGPWAGFLTLCSVLIIQCLVFADGGLMALGCNIVNMAAASCLIGYPLVFRPLAGRRPGTARLIFASVAASVVALEAGALGVTLETEISGVTALPLSTFLAFMLPIHLAIGAVEGVATGAVLAFIARYRPETLYSPVPQPAKAEGGRRSRGVVWGFVAGALLLGGGFTWLASAYPDGLEWSIEKASGLTELPSAVAPTAVMPDYNSTFAGIIGATIVMLMLWAVTALLLGRHRPKALPKTPGK